MDCHICNKGLSILIHEDVIEIRREVNGIIGKETLVCHTDCYIEFATEDYTPPLPGKLRN